MSLSLKQIEISGFKSFGKKAVLDFKTPITAVVGPNGSGKSNVAEAFSFVLGEQSMKSMRGKKGEDLIYNGSASGQRANRASVKVVFDNKKKFLDIDFDEVSVERVVFRDGTNEYSINGTATRLKDIVELLAGANIGSTGHHIISQGEADSVLNVNPKERKAIIEDALGLRIYQIRRRESERKLEKTEENIKQVESLRKEIKPHLNFLKKQVEKIEKTLEMKNDLVDLYKEYLYREELYLKDKKEYIDREVREPKEKLKALEKQIGELEKVASSKQQVSRENTELKEVEKELQDLRKKKGELVLELGRFEGELNSLKKVGGAPGNVSSQKVKELTDELEEKLEILEGESDMGLFKRVFGEIKKLVKDFSGSLKGSGGSSFDGDISELEKKIKEAQGKVEALTKEEEDLVEDLADLQKELEKSKSTGIESERKMFNLKNEYSELMLKVTSLQSLEERVEMEEGEFKRELTEAAVLVGRDVLSYQGAVKESKAEILGEEREKQEKRRRDIEKIKIRLEDAGGASGEEIMKEFEEVGERDGFLEREVGDLEKSQQSLKSLIKDLDEKLEKEFDQGLEKINKQFQEFFSLMFGGGSASLKVTKEIGNKKLDETGEAEEEAETTEGVSIEVNLPRKKIKGLMMLSGGERALTSIALLFAMSQVNPPPFIILDETDAALDEANSRKYGDMIANLSKHSQLILITHNRETMSRAGVLYGVTMDSSGVSKLLSVDLEEAVEVAK